jgi:hypothetical protein
LISGIQYYPNFPGSRILTLSKLVNSQERVDSGKTFLGITQGDALCGVPYISLFFHDNSII